MSVGTVVANPGTNPIGTEGGLDCGAFLSNCVAFVTNPPPPSISQNSKALFFNFHIR